MADVRERVDTVADMVSLVCSLLPVIRNRELGGRQTMMMGGEKVTHRKRQLADGYLRNSLSLSLSLSLHESSRVPI
jgi:hypothetical protein